MSQEFPFEVDPEVRALFAGRNLDDLTPADLNPPAAPLTADEAAALFAALNIRILDGRAAASERAGLIGRLHRENPQQWTQSAIGAAAGISQAAVSKALKTTPGRLALEENHTGPYLIGRMVGLAIHLSDRHRGMRCERHAWKIAEGGLPPVAGVIGQLRAMLSHDLARPGIPDAYRTALADITAGLDDLAEYPSWPWSTADRGNTMLAQHHQSKWLTDELAQAGKRRAN